MSLFHRLHGARSCQLRQLHRRTDGVRGLFAQQPLLRGDLVLMMPLRYCYITFMRHGLATGGGRIHQAMDNPGSARALRRWNRGVALFPEAWAWLARLSPDAASDRVTLTSTVSYEVPENVYDPSDGDSKTPTPSTSRPTVASLTLSPVEAALAVSVALRYFYANAVHLTRATRLSQRVGPAPHEATDCFVSLLPFERYLEWGLESSYESAAVGEAHLCLEQLSHNLRDAVLTWATSAEYRFLDEFPSLLDHVLLTSLYLVRSRVLRVPLLTGNPRRDDGVCGVFAPGLEGLNHSSAAPSAAAVISLPQRAVAVRAVRRIARGEEITLDYRSSPIRRQMVPASGGVHELCMDDDWASRFLMNS